MLIAVLAKEGYDATKKIQFMCGIGSIAGNLCFDRFYTAYNCSGSCKGIIECNQSDDLGRRDL